MNLTRMARLGAAGIAATAAVVGLAVSPAAAGGNGATTGTQHAHGDDAAGLVVLDFTPENGAPPLPADCWANPGLAIVSTTGNAVQHFTVNKADDFWFTTTYAGDAAVYPVAQPVTFDDNGNVVVDTSNGPLDTGHLTTWFGEEDNKQNEVNHATVSFHGTNAAGQAVNLNAHVQYGSNANGDPTVSNASVNC